METPVKSEKILVDRCISCLIQNVSFQSEGHLIAAYKEFITNQVEKKFRGIKILFCDNCAEVLNTIQAFKTTCIDSLAVLEDLLKDTYEEQEILKLTIPEIKQESDSEAEDHDSDFHPGGDESSASADAFSDTEDIKEELTETKVEGTVKKIPRSKRKRRLRNGEEKEKNCHKCPECDKAFPRPANLRNHFLKKHRNAKHCKYCQKAFEDEEEFKNHMEMEQKRLLIKKEKQQKLHVCEICGLTTKFRSNLVKHMDTHLPDSNSVKCDICQKSFKSLMLLKNHIMYHKEKTFVCTVCGRKFLFAKDLERHGRLVHEKLTEYTTCSICSKQVSAKGLNSHVKQVHMDIRPHTCPVCNLAFKSSSNLKKHLYSHSGTRPYNCHVCGHGSYMSCTLKEHYQKIHGLTYSNDELNQVCIKTTPTLQQINRNSSVATASSPNRVHNTEILVTLPSGIQMQQIVGGENSISNG